MENLNVSLVLVVTLSLYCANILNAKEDDDAIRVSAGPGFLYPSLSAQLLFNDNLTYQADEESETLGIKASPGLRYIVEDNTRRLTADWLLDSGFYESSDDDNYVDNFLNGRFEYQPTDRFNGAISAFYKDAHDPRGTGRNEGVAGPVQQDFDKWHSTGARGNFAYGLETTRARIEAEAGYETREYDNNREFTFARDRDDAYGSGRFFYRLGPLTELLVEGRITGYKYDEDAPNALSLNSDVWRILGGVTWEATYKSTGYAKLGYIEKDFDSGARSGGEAATWEVGVEWRPRTYSKVNFATSRDFQETNGAGDFIQHDSFIGTWVHYWAHHISSEIEFSYFNDRFEPSPREDELLRVGFTINFTPGRWLKTGVGYVYAKRASNDDAFDYERNIFMITVSSPL